MLCDYKIYEWPCSTSEGRMITVEACEHSYVMLVCNNAIVTFWNAL